MPPLLFIREAKSLLFQKSTTVFQGILNCCDIGRTEVQRIGAEDDGGWGALVTG